MFSMCSALKIKKIPASVHTISERAFFRCNNLVLDAHDALPSTLQSIGEKAFEGCAKLNIRSLPPNVTIGNGAFKGCDEMRKEDSPVYKQIIGKNEYAFQ